MKIAISGKGGVGKTTLAAMLIRTMSDKGMTVLAIDADPDANLGQALGYEDYSDIIPISRMRELIAERTGAEPGTYGTFFKLNPKVDDLPAELAKSKDNIRLMVLGGVEKGGGGCICPESTMLKALVTHLLLFQNEHLVMDMEAGVEHLGRGTSRAVDRFIVVVEPGRRSLETAEHIRRLAGDLGVQNVALVANKIRSGKDREYLEKALPDFNFLGFMPYDDKVIEADLAAESPYDHDPAIRAEINKIVDNLLDQAG